MGVVVDTSTLVDLERRDESIGTLLQQAPESFLASVVLAELLSGVHLSRRAELRAKRLAWIEAIVIELPLIGFGEPEARTYAEIRAAVRFAGHTIGERDMMIAATALANGHDVLTANVREFERVPGLRVVTLDELAT